MKRFLCTEFIKGLLHLDKGSIVLRVLFAAGFFGAVVSARAFEPFVITQPASQTNFVGGAITFSVDVAGTGPLCYQWLFNDSALVGETNSRLMLTNLQLTNGGLYSVQVSNAFGSVVSESATLRVFSTGPGSLDLTFPTVLTSFRTWEAVGPSVSEMVKQPDGKVLILGEFDHVNGFPCSTVARLLRNGDLDSSFENWAVAPKDNYISGVSTLALQADGKILVGGSLLYCVGGCDTLVRLYPNGDRDWNFSVPHHEGTMTKIIVQPDQRILLAGTFYWPDRTNCLIRLNTDGSLDGSFTPHEQWVRDMVLQQDGKIVIIGTGSTWEEGYLGRLNPDGALDASFDVSTRGWRPDLVYSVALQPDGKILLTGDFTNVCHQGDCVAQSKLTRLNPDGSVDLTFDSNSAATHYWGIYFIAVQPDGKILISGEVMVGWDGCARASLTRLNPDGSFDSTFIEGVMAEDINELDEVCSILFQDNGKIWVGGIFSAYNTGGARCYGTQGCGSPFISFNNVPHDGLVRLNNDLTVCRLKAGSRTPAGDFQFVVSTLPGARVLIERSFDLVTWTPLAGRISADGELAFSDASADDSQHFYRARLLE